MKVHFRETGLCLIEKGNLRYIDAWRQLPTLDCDVIRDMEFAA